MSGAIEMEKREVTRMTHQCRGYDQIKATMQHPRMDDAEKLASIRQTIATTEMMMEES